MPADKPTELSRIKLKNLNSTASPYDQQAFSPLDLTASWLSHMALAIYMFVVGNFDALVQASDIRIERRQVVVFIVVNFDTLPQASDIQTESRQVVFLCWMQDLNPWSQTPNRQHTYTHACMHAYRQTDTRTYIQFKSGDSCQILAWYGVGDMVFMNCLPIEYRVHIRQVSLQPSCGVPCQTWFKRFRLWYHKSQI